MGQYSDSGDSDPRPEQEIPEETKTETPPKKGTTASQSSQPALSQSPQPALLKYFLPDKLAYLFRTFLPPGGDLLVFVDRRYVVKDGIIRNKYEQQGNFMFIGCRSKPKAFKSYGVTNMDFNSLGNPEDTKNVFMTFEAISAKKLTFLDHQSIEILQRIPNLYNLLYPHQLEQLQLKPFYPFFYQDEQHTYSVIPKQELVDLVVSADHLSFSFDTNIVADDPLAAEHKLPDRGDRVPRVSRTNVSVAGGSKNTAISEKRIIAAEESKPTLSSAAKEMTLAGLQPGTMEHESSNSSSMLQFEMYEAFVSNPSVTYLKFSTFYQPHVCTWIKTLNRKGIPGLLTLENQQLSNDKHKPLKTLFKQEYDPTHWVHSDYPKEDVDFNNSGAYSLYNWEVFFHAPLIIATHLSQNQRFEEAQKWFHYIFNPTDSSPEPSPQRYWKVLPFYNNTSPENDRIQELLALLSYKGFDQDTLQRKADVEDQVKQWRDNPFNPHLIARLRITAYQKTVVMKYIDNLIAWADQLFSRDTIESINEATQLYILAYNMLGPRPERIPARDKAQPQTYAMLKDKLDSFSNKLVQMENVVLSSVSDSSSSNGSNSSGTGSLNLGTTFYFCIPKNDKLLEYWDTVADRLFKIRHCMNIEGMVRQLPLFEPPINPALLVRATAMGVDLSSALSDMNAALPHYRFSYMSQKALELCAELKSLGGALLSALEKKDAEKLSAIRASHETSMLKAVREVKQKQIDEASNTLEGLQKSKDVVTIRRNYYRDIVYISDNEQLNMDSLNRAHDFSEVAQGLNTGVSGAHMIPDFHTGAAGFSSPYIVAKFGGANLGNALQAAAGVVNMISAIHTHKATMASIKGGYNRRWDDWKQQEKLANKELEQIDKQIASANIRIAIAEKDLENHDLQIENATTIEEFLRDKYTNEELYNWMLSQISAIFFQSYKLAYDVAKRAERTYRFERGLTSSSFIQFGYWDSLRKGLLSGERLYLDLKRLEMAYLDQNKREYEIAKQISLVLHDPMALISLKETGLCEIILPEALFDMDYPGHYMRRIKSVSLTIPCVTGPYTNINCTLTLLSNKIRTDNKTSNSYEEDTEGDDPRFLTNFAAIQSIVTSSAQNDSGMFELNFRDERYLPFEGAGAVSRWRIDMPKDCNAFDFDTISDVIIKLNYTAREGGEILKKAAKQAVQNASADAEKAPLARLFSAKHEFSTEWYRFLHPVDSTAPSQKLELALTPERFPFQFRGKKIKISQVELFLQFKDINNEETYKKDGTPLGDYATGTALTLSLNQLPEGTEVRKSLDSISSFLNGIPQAAIVLNDPKGFGTWVVEAKDADIQQIATTLRYSQGTHQRLKADAIADIIIVCHYSV